MFVTALLNLRLVLILTLAGSLLDAAMFTTTLEPDTVVAWNSYIDRFERAGLTNRPMLDARKMVLSDLNPSGSGVPNGYIHHWIGAMRMANVPLEKVRSVIGDYGHWQQIYAPDIRFISAARIDDDTEYDLRMVSEQTQGLMHFAFDMHFRVRFEQVGDFQMAKSRSYLIRESDGGRAPYTDLLPEGRDHGILWRLNTYWRLKQDGTSTYAECQVISLSRKPIPGSTALVKARARESLRSTMTATARAAQPHKLD
jgi:hypothetical protein